MNTRRILFILALFLCFLGLYTYNVRTNNLDDLSTNTGLELSGGVFKFANSITSSVQSFWLTYIDNIEARKENEELKHQIIELERKMFTFQEDLAELARLRDFYALEIPEEWNSVAARVIAGRLGAFSTLDTLILDKGYLAGAKVGRPLMTGKYLVGRILKASPTTSMALLANDFGSKIAVVSEKSRLHGVLSGTGSGQPLEVHFINQDSSLISGEILYTSGLDNVFPKGLPVAEVTGSQSLALNSFKIYYAKSLADFSSLEELLVLIPPVGWLGVEENEAFAPRIEMENYLLLPDEFIENKEASDQEAE